MTPTVTIHDFFTREFHHYVGDEIDGGHEHHVPPVAALEHPFASQRRVSEQGFHLRLGVVQQGKERCS